MSHRLEPLDDRSYLDPEEVAARLKDEFDYCAVDRDEGSDMVRGIIAKLIELKAPQAIIDQQVAAQERALQVVIADDSASDDYLQFTVKPDEGILIGYFSGQHEEATQPLVKRCAEVLNYRIDLL